MVVNAIFVQVGLILALFGNKAISSPTQCVPIPECSPVKHLLDNKDNLPNMTRNEVYEYLRGIQCGFSGYVPKIICPLVIEGK